MFEFVEEHFKVHTWEQNPKLLQSNSWAGSVPGHKAKYSGPSSVWNIGLLLSTFFLPPFSSALSQKAFWRANLLCVFCFSSQGSWSVSWKPPDLEQPCFSFPQTLFYMSSFLLHWSKPNICVGGIRPWMLSSSNWKANNNLFFFLNCQPSNQAATALKTEVCCLLSWLPQK